MKPSLTPFNQGILYVFAHIVAQKEPVPGALGGIETDRRHDAGRAFAHVYPLIDYLFGQFGGGQSNPVLEVDLVNVRIGAHVKGDT